MIYVWYSRGPGCPNPFPACHKPLHLASFLPAMWSPPQLPSGRPISTRLGGCQEKMPRVLSSGLAQEGTQRAGHQCTTALPAHPGSTACLQDQPTEGPTHRASESLASLIRACACRPVPYAATPAAGSSVTSGAKVIVTINGTPKSLPDAPCLFPARGLDKSTSLIRVRSSCPHRCQWPGPTLPAPE